MTIQALLQNKNYEELSQYINELSELLDLKKQYVNTGSRVLDSILNFKIMEAEKLGIKINADVQFPSDVKLNAYNVTVIFGNLIDNAMQASKTVYLKVRYDKGRLLLKIWNDFEGTIKFNDHKKIITTKKDSQNHGIGLENIRRVIEKYNGVMEIELQENTFTVFVMLYLEHKTI